MTICSKKKKKNNQMKNKKNIVMTFMQKNNNVYNYNAWLILPKKNLKLKFQN